MCSRIAKRPAVCLWYLSRADGRPLLSVRVSWLALDRLQFQSAQPDPGSLGLRILHSEWNRTWLVKLESLQWPDLHKHCPTLEGGGGACVERAQPGSTVLLCLLFL